MRIEKTVLLIDDDEDDLQMLEEALKIIDGEHKTVRVTPSGFFSNLEFLKNLKEMHQLRMILDDDGVNAIPTDKLSN
jgi:CheY-like chemotaxis protein